MTGDRSDPYAVLGLSARATQEEIRRAYRRLVRQHHPDTRSHDVPSDDAASGITLQRVISAYAVLGDPARRARYDHLTAPHRASTPIRTHPALRSPPAPLHQPPIQAGPVRWHRSR